LNRISTLADPFSSSALHPIEEKPKLSSIIGLVYVVVAGVGGLFFVLSGFTNNGSSAKMDGGFIGAYAFYFV
jgi:hypothetical protein